MTLDVTDGRTVKNAIQSITDEVSRIDVLVNNADYTVDLLRDWKLKDIFSIDVDIFDIVLMSYARLSRRPLLFESFTGLEIREFKK
jgi:NAD(P)-dependent dehydrogenase (short-subunit alcohol dehydrogenase family)